VPYITLCRKCCGIGVFPEVLSELGILENKVHISAMTVLAEWDGALSC